VSSVIGAQATLVWAGAIGSVVTLAALFLPGMRAIENTAPRAGTGEPEALPSTLSSPPAEERRAA
jgi:hypothetical protein